MIKDHSDSERGNPLPPLHVLLFLISSQGSTIWDRSDDPSHHKWTLYHGATSLSLVRRWPTRLIIHILGLFFNCPRFSRRITIYHWSFSCNPRLAARYFSFKMTPRDPAIDQDFRVPREAVRVIFPCVTNFPGEVTLLLRGVVSWERKHGGNGSFTYNMVTGFMSDCSVNTDVMTSTKKSKISFLVSVFVKLAGFRYLVSLCNKSVVSTNSLLASVNIFLNC